MDRLDEFLEDIQQNGRAKGNFLGLLNVLIGRHIEKSDGTPVSKGLTWRLSAAMLKNHQWDIESVHELGLDPMTFRPRDREKFWYAVIKRAAVDSEEASRAG